MLMENSVREVREPLCEGGEISAQYSGATMRVKPAPIPEMKFPIIRIR